MVVGGFLGGRDPVDGGSLCRWRDIQLDKFGNDLGVELGSQPCLVFNRLVGGWSQAGGGHGRRADFGPDLHLGGFWSDVGVEQRAERPLGIGCQFSGWNQTDCNHPRSLLHVNQFGNLLDFKRHALGSLERGCLFSGWNEVGGGGDRLRRAFHSYLHEFRRHLGDE